MNRTCIHIENTILVHAQMRRMCIPSLWLASPPTTHAAAQSSVVGLGTRLEIVWVREFRSAAFREIGRPKIIIYFLPVPISTAFVHYLSPEIMILAKPAK